MLVVVNTVSALVHIYSIGYMAHDDGQPRFFAYLSLFTFAMLMLVTADNLLQLFFGWEGVGLASYLLIGFWYHKPSANARRRSRRSSSTASAISASRWASSPSSPSSARSRYDAIFASAPDQVGKTMTFLGYQLRYADGDLPAAVRRRDGQVGAIPAAHLAARRDGRPDAGFRAHPCGDHGDGRRLHGCAPVAAVRAGAGRAASA